MQQVVEAALGHIIKDYQFPILFHVARPNPEQIVMLDLAKHLCLKLELPVTLGHILPKPPDGHIPSILQHRLVHRPVPGRSKDTYLCAEQVFHGECNPIVLIQMHKLMSKDGQ